MKVECPVSELFAAVTNMVKSAPKVSSFRARFSVENLELTATSEYQTTAATIKTDGIYSASYSFVGAPDASLLKGFTGACMVETIDDARMTVSQNGQNVASYAITIDESPALPAVDVPVHGFTVESKLIKNVLTKCAKTSGDYSGKEVMSLTIVRCDDRLAIDVASTDSIRLTLCQFGAAGTIDAPSQNLVVRSDGARSILKILPKADMVDVRYDGDFVYFRWTDATVRLVRSLNRFPNYSSIMPKSQTCVWNADVSKLSAAMKSLLPAAKANSKGCRATLELLPDSSQLVIRVMDVVNGVDLERTVQLDRCEGVDKKTQKLVFNLSYFLEYLGTNDHKFVSVGWTSTTYPATLQPLEQSDELNVTVILMPVTHY